jgi:hypothetical protein
MKRFSKRAITAGIATATVAASGVALTAAEGSSTRAATSHTLRIVAHQTATHSAGKFSFIGQDTDRRRSDGKIIGYDTISGHFYPKQNRVVINVAVGLRGGILLARLHQSASSNAFKGTVTGGRGRYAGASGTITGHSPSQNSKRTFVTVHYML